MECLICHEEVNVGIWGHLKKKHKMSYKEYYDIYLKTDDDGICKYCGKETKFKKGNVGYFEYCVECQKFNQRHWEFWVIRYNFTEEDAKLHVGKRNAHGKEHFIKKYGDEIGCLKFKERNDKMSSTAKINNKKTREIDPDFFKRKSQYSEIFWKSRGYSKEDVSFKLNTVYEAQANRVSQAFVDGKFDKRILPSNIEYWTNQGFTKDEAKEKVSERQSTFTLEKCIEKYGMTEGMMVHEERQRKWQQTLNDKPIEERDRIRLAKQAKDNYSMISQELFWEVCRQLIDVDKIYFAELNKEFITAVKNGNRVYSYDFVDTKNKKCIEFNGEIFHANPKTFKETDTPNPYNRKLTAKDIWVADELKLDHIKSMGYNVLVIWENDYKLNKNDTITQCVKFMEN